MMSEALINTENVCNLLLVTYLQKDMSFNSSKSHINRTGSMNLSKFRRFLVLLFVCSNICRKFCVDLTLTLGSFTFCILIISDIAWMIFLLNFHSILYVVHSLSYNKPLKNKKCFIRFADRYILSANYYLYTRLPKKMQL